MSTAANSTKGGEKGGRRRRGLGRGEGGEKEEEQRRERREAGEEGENREGGRERNPDSMCLQTTSPVVLPRDWK